MGEFKESVIVAGGTDPPALTRGKSSESLQTQFTAEQLEAKTPVQKGDTYVNPPDAQEVTPVSLEERFPDALCIIRYSETFASDIKAASRLFSWKAHYVLDNFDVVHKYDAQGDLLSEIHPAYFPLRVMRGECGQTPEQKEPPKQVDSVPEPVPSVKEKGGADASMEVESEHGNPTASSSARTGGPGVVRPPPPPATLLGVPVPEKSMYEDGSYWVTLGCIFIECRVLQDGPLHAEGGEGEG